MDANSQYFTGRQTRMQALPEEVRTPLEQAASLSDNPDQFLDRVFMSNYIAHEHRQDRQSSFEGYEGVAVGFGYSGDPSKDYDDMVSYYQGLQDKQLRPEFRQRSVLAEYGLMLPAGAQRAAMQKMAGGYQAAAGLTQGALSAKEELLHRRQADLQKLAWGSTATTPSRKALGAGEPETGELFTSEWLTDGDRQEQVKQLRTEVAALESEVKAERDAFLQTWMGSTHRAYLEQGEFWDSLAKETMSRWNISDEAANSLGGMILTEIGALPTSLAAAALGGPKGWVGAAGGLAGWGLIFARIFNEVETAAREAAVARGETYDPNKHFAQKLAAAIPATLMERLFGFERIVSGVLKSGVKMTSRNFGRTVARQALAGGAEEGITEPTQGFWMDFVARMSIDPGRELFSAEALKQRGLEAFLGAVVGAFGGGVIGGANFFDQSVIAGKHVTNTLGMPMTAANFKLVREYKTDDQIRAHFKDSPETGELLIRAANGDKLAADLYNARMVVERGLLEVEYQGIGMTVGKYNDRRMILNDKDGKALVVDEKNERHLQLLDVIRRGGQNEQRADILRRHNIDPETIPDDADVVAYRDPVTGEEFVEVQKRHETVEQLYGSAALKLFHLPGVGAVAVGGLTPVVAEEDEGLWVVRSYSGNEIGTARTEEEARKLALDHQQGMIENTDETVAGFFDFFSAWNDGDFKIDDANYKTFRQMVKDRTITLKQARAWVSRLTGLPADEVTNYALGQYILLGRSQSGWRKKVWHNSVRIYKGASYTAVIEEFAELYAKERLHRYGDLEERQMREWKLHLEENGYKTEWGNDEAGLIEWFSDLAVDWVSGKALRGMKNPNYPPGFHSFLIQLRAVVQQIFDRAFKLMSLHEEGLLPPDLAKHLDRATGWDAQFIDSKVRAAEMEQSKRDAGRVPENELMAQLKALGGLPSPNSSKFKREALSGELRELWNEWPKNGPYRRLAMWRKDADSLDDIRGRLKSAGFGFSVVSDLVEAIKSSLRGEEVYPDYSGGGHLSQREWNATAETFQAAAWHGSPHVFDKFDSSKIGTGEGAQAYGRGLYFASRRAVGEHYKNALSKTGIKHKWVGRSSLLEVDELLRYGLVDVHTKNDLIDYLNGLIEDMEASGEPDLNQIDTVKTTLKLIESGELEITDAPPGRLYKVDLKPSEDEYMLWDEPLVQQSEKVQEALNQIVDAIPEDLLDGYVDALNVDTDEWTGKDFLQVLVRMQEDDGYPAPPLASDVERALFAGDGEMAASMYLLSLGVRGVKYLDGSSRREGEGSYNYVIFDDSDIEIIETFQAAPTSLIGAGQMFAGQEDGERMPIRTIQEAVRVQQEMIRQYNLGGSDTPRVNIYDAAGNVRAYLSYNGRVWIGEYPNSRLIYDPTENPYGRDRATEYCVFDKPAWVAGGDAIDVETTYQVAYHGSTLGIDKFNVPAFFADSKHDAAWFAKERMGDEPAVYKVDIKGGNTLDLTHAANPGGLERMMRRLKDSGVVEMYLPGDTIPEGNKGYEYSAQGEMHDYYSPEISQYSPYEGLNPLDILYVPAAREWFMQQGYDVIRADDTLESEEITATIVLNPDKVEILEVDDFSGDTFQSAKLTQRDTEYLAAVKAGDMEAAQRMVHEAATSSGAYMTGPVWRGGDKRQDILPTGMLDAIFFSNNREFAEDFAWGDGYTGRYYLDTRKLFDFRNPDHISKLMSDLQSWGLLGKDGDLGQQFGFTRADLEAGGFYGLESPPVQAHIRGNDYAGFMTGEGPGNLNYAIYDNRLAKSADPVTYDADGNVIPLSQRFDSSRPEATFQATELGDGFKKWYKGSELVDADGNPIPLYHGSKQDIDEFKARFPDGLIFLSFDPDFAANWTKGIGGIRDRMVGEKVSDETINAHKAEDTAWRESVDWDRAATDVDYATDAFNRHPRYKRLSEEWWHTAVYPVYVRATKIFDPRKDYKLVEPVLRKMSGMDGILKQGAHKVGNWIVYENEQVVDLLKKNGYDAMLLAEDASYLKDKAPHDTLAVFSPTQIKSATGNRGTFDPGNPNITFQAAPYAGPVILEEVDINVGQNVSLGAAFDFWTDDRSHGDDILAGAAVAVRRDVPADAMKMRDGGVLRYWADRVALAANEEFSGGTYQTAKLTQRDTEYLAAVKAGDMEAAQRMVHEAAVEAGLVRIVASFPDGVTPALRRAGNWVSLDNQVGHDYQHEYAGADWMDRSIRGYVRQNAWDDQQTGWANGQTLVLREDSVSADPVTYDEQGKPIPLSQRFNSSRPEITFQAAKMQPRWRPQRKSYGDYDWTADQFPQPDGTTLAAPNKSGFLGIISNGKVHGKPFADVTVVDHSELEPRWTAHDSRFRYHFPTGTVSWITDPTNDDRANLKEWAERNNMPLRRQGGWEVIPTWQAAPLREMLTGDLLEGQKRSVEAVAKLISDRSNQWLRENDIVPSSMSEQEIVELVMSVWEDEISTALTGEDSGVEWYNSDIAYMERSLKAMFPSLRKHEMVIAKAFQALTSFGNTPFSNFGALVRMLILADGDVTKVTPTQPNGKGWTARKAAVEGGVNRIQALIADKGSVAAAAKWLLEEHPVAELRKYKKSGVTGKKGDMRYGAFILGPKGGPFFLNLNGVEQELTMDLWFSRSWNRVLGTLLRDNATVQRDEEGEIVGSAQIQETPRNDAERRLMRDATNRLADKMGLTVRDLQAVMWYYEQRLYETLGAKSSYSGSYRHAAGRYLAAAGFKSPTGFEYYRKTAQGGKDARFGDLASAHQAGVPKSRRLNLGSTFSAAPKRLSQKTGIPAEKLYQPDPNPPHMEAADEIFNEIRIGQLNDILERKLKHENRPEQRSKQLAKQELGLSRMGGNIMSPIASRLRRIHPRLGEKLRRFEGDLMRDLHRLRSEVVPWLERFSQLNPETQATLKVALSDGSRDIVSGIHRQHGMEDDFRRVRDVLDGLRERLRSAGYDVGYIDNYFPRVVRNYEDLYYHFHGTELYGPMEEALMAAEKRAHDKGTELTEEERAIVIERFLRGRIPAGSSSAPTSTKSRKVASIADIAEFYLDPGDALMQHIERIVAEVSKQKFFGKDGVWDEVSIDTAPGQLGLEGMDGEPVTKMVYRRVNVSNSIDKLVLRLLEEGKIDRNQQREIKEVLEGRFAYRVSDRWVQITKGVNFAVLLSNIGSVLQQVQDVTWSLYESGFFWTLGEYGKAMLNKSEIKTRSALGIERMGQEFESPDRVWNTVDLFFRVSGFSYVDRLGKDTLVNARIGRLRQRARRGTLTPRDMEKLVATFGDQVDAVVAELAAGVKNENTLIIAFSTLSDYQPVSLAEMPLAYQRNPNGRFLYTLKTFTIKMLDAFRREGWDEIAKGNVRRGIRQLMLMAAIFWLSGVPIDWIKDWIYGRDKTLTDAMIDNIYKLGGISRYNLYYARENGPVAGVMKVFAPPLPMLEFPYTDVNNFWDAVSAGEDFGWKDMESVRLIPFIGKEIYWHFGLGKQKLERQAWQRLMRGEPEDD